jgi:hypothetical protein
VLALAIVAKDSKALTPARASLAQLLAQAERLRVETEPLAEQLRRCDEVAARADRALAHRDRLLEEHDAAVAESIVRRRPRPDSMLVDEAEVALREPRRAVLRALARPRAWLLADPLRRGRRPVLLLERRRFPTRFGRAPKSPLAVRWFTVSGSAPAVTLVGNGGPPTVGPVERPHLPFPGPPLAAPHRSTDSGCAGGLFCFGRRWNPPGVAEWSPGRFVCQRGRAAFFGD